MRIGVIMACAMSLYGVAGATAVTIDDFPANSTVITFDDLQGGQCNLCGPSVTDQYAALGVIFNNPSFPGQDTADTNLTAGVPNATLPNAVFVNQGGGATGISAFQVLFSVPVTMVGLDFASSFDSFLELQAFSKDGSLLEQINVVGDTTTFIGLGGFAGIAESTPIAEVDISYHPNFNTGESYNFSMDNLIYATPEPSSLALMGAGLAVGFSRLLLRIRKARAK